MVITNNYPTDGNGEGTTETHFKVHGTSQNFIKVEYNVEFQKDKGTPQK